MNAKPLGITTCAAVLLLAACGPTAGDTANPGESEPAAARGAEATAERGAAPGSGLAKATFAGGCFWCMEHPFDELPGVASTTSGYIGGRTEDPTYEEVSSGGTGHAEAVEIAYDPAEITYEELLAVFWRNVDPTDAGGQFCDRGRQYRTGIFTHGEEQQRAGVASKRAVEERLGGPLATEVVPAGPFYAAEEYHQDYYRKNPVRYRFYRTGCGRDRRLQELWGEEAGGHGM